MSNVEHNIDRKPADIRREIAQPVALQFDPAQYLAELDGYDLTDAQKHELMAVMWDLLSDIVRLGFSVDVCSALLGGTNPIPHDGELR